MNLGEGVAERSQCVEQRCVVGDGDAGDCEFASDALRHLARMFHTGLQCVEGAVGCVQKRAARRRQSHFAFAARQQADSQFVFQSVNRLTECRLGHVQALGCFMEVQFFGNGNELLEQSGLDHGVRSLL